MSDVPRPANCNTACEHAFVVGQDREGHWLAVETHGLGGGIFTTQEAALRYARAETERRPGAVALAGEAILLTMTRRRAA